MTDTVTSPEETPDLLIRTEGLGRAFSIGDQYVHALNDVVISIRRGEFVTIMGPSGSGKSTLLNVLGLLDRPTNGQYFLEGIDVSDIDPDKRAEIRNHKLGFVFQSFSLLPRTTALENIELPLIYRGVPKDQREHLAAKALSEVGLEQRLHHLPSQLSGGEQQRVAIARALVNDASLIFADEPTGALDSRTGADIMNLLQHLHRSGRTLIMVTHDMNVAEYAERMILLRDGRVMDDKPIHKAKIFTQEQAEQKPTVTERESL